MSEEVKAPEESDRWADLIAEDIEDYSEPEPELEPTPEPEAEAEQSPSVEEEKKEEPPAEPAQPAQEAQLAPKPTLTPEQVKELRAKFEETLASKFTFSEEEAIALQTEPEKVLPKMAAKLYADVLEDVGKLISSSVPSMLQEYAVTMEREMRAKTEFFSEWPELKGYEQQVLMVGEMYRRMNPDAPPQEAIKRIGEIAMATLGLQRQKAPAEPPPPQQPAFRPAGAGKIPSPPPQPTKWEQIFED